MFKWLEGGMVEITASYPAGVIGTTLENLKAAAAGENEEWSKWQGFFFDEYIFPMVSLPYLCFLVFSRIAFKWSFMSGLYLWFAPLASCDRTRVALFL